MIMDEKFFAGKVSPQGDDCSNFQKFTAFVSWLSSYIKSNIS
jgi:hypothetical protein